MTLSDQFHEQTTDLGATSLFMAPADKNGEGIIDSFSHLTCYEILEGVPAPPRAIVENQFGRHELDLGFPRELCVPSEKLLSTGPVTLDHYKCYESAGEPLYNMLYGRCRNLSFCPWVQL